MAKDKPRKNLGNTEYYERLEPLHLELNDMARWLLATGKRRSEEHTSELQSH